ncbi:GntR family transcriptional regulator [candidate division KSB1 bacterium]|nr:GntR family transcriptional regulator [candidate division KSB1 bacterium]
MIIDRNSPIPQYFQLQTWIIEHIEQGVFKPDEKIPTEEEFSQMTGLARATIRQAIQNCVNMGYLYRKRRLGTFVIKQNLNVNKKTIIGVMVPDIRTGYAPELARGIGDEAAANKHSIILCNTDDFYIKTNFHADNLIEHNVSGVIYVPTAASDEKNRMILEKFTRKNIPVVLADRVIPDANVDYATTDNFQGAYELTKYLVNKGHKRIAVILSTLFSTERQRFDGYKQALSDSNIPFDPSIVVADQGPFLENFYIKYVKKLLDDNNITAVFAGHDRIAYLVYTVARQSGLRIPEDISLVGYDDLPSSSSHPVRLTTMHQPIYEMGKQSMKLIMSRINGDVSEPQKVILKSYLVERFSVRTIHN